MLATLLLVIILFLQLKALIGNDLFIFVVGETFTNLGRGVYKFIRQFEV